MPNYDVYFTSLDGSDLTLYESNQGNGGLWLDGPPAIVGAATVNAQISLAGNGSEVDVYYLLGGDMVLVTMVLTADGVEIEFDMEPEMLDLLNVTVHLNLDPMAGGEDLNQQ